MRPTVRRIGGILAAATLAGAGMAAVGLASPGQRAHAEQTRLTGTVRAELPLAIRSGPGTGFTVTGHAGSGERYAVLCYTDGDTETGWGGTNRHWDQVATTDDPGHGLGYVADVWLDTGGDVTAQGVPECAERPAPKPADHSLPYVAMGDSYSSGEGDYGNYEPGTDDAGRYKCHRSPRAYPRRLLANLPPQDRPLDFVACSGAVTRNVVDLHDPAVFQAPDPGITEPPQIDKVGPNTRLITLTVGGNDAGFPEILQSCLTNGGCAEHWQATLADRYAKLAVTLPKVYAAIRAKAPNARLAVLTYPQVFATGQLCLTGTGRMSLDDVAWVHDRWHEFDQIIARSAAAAGATLVDQEDTFAGHEVCAEHPWANGIHATGFKDPEQFHPTPDGHDAEYQELVRALGLV